ncbi:unnamed protein product [Acidithrix sp. C25]|nr:unnamed protein product [Acidithrix sp. C25]
MAGENLSPTISSKSKIKLALRVHRSHMGNWGNISILL